MKPPSSSRNSLAQPIIAEPPLEEWTGDDLSFLDNDMENFEPQTDTISQSANNSVLLPKTPNKHVHFNNGRSPLKEMVSPFADSFGFIKYERNNKFCTFYRRETLLEPTEATKAWWFNR